MVSRYDIEFVGEQDVTIRGWLFAPAATSSKPSPAISMCHGFGAVKEHALEKFAQAFAEAGFVVLVHDHRNFGASDGVPRGDIDPWMQIADWRRAISFLETVPEVDASKIGIWGSSYSGGHALVLAATDNRVKCVVSQVPTISGFEQSRRRISPDNVAAFLEGMTADMRLTHRGKAPATQSVVSDDPGTPAAYRTREAIDFYMRDIGTANWNNTVTIRSSFAARLYEPGTWISRISPKPLLMVIANDDCVTLTDLELRAYEDALEPKRLVIIEGGHFAPYDIEFPTASSAAVQWFQQHLPSF
ncbi:alpha/beta hydrolase [Pseudoduganella dura]|nr:alpha/beta hydrolase [Pseudoduganella dura]GGX80402.1 hypothetical protein GCM10007386_09210 [Pseudoduganella dura]